MEEDEVGERRGEVVVEEVGEDAEEIAGGEGGDDEDVGEGPKEVVEAMEEKEGAEEQEEEGRR